MTVGFRSVSFRRLVRSSSSSLSLDSELTCLLHGGTQLIDGFIVITFDVPVLGNFAACSSTPVFGPSEVFFSSFDTMDEVVKVYRISVSFLVTTRGSSPHVSNVVVSRVVGSNLCSFAVMETSLPLLRVYVICISREMYPEWLHGSSLSSAVDGH